MFLKIRLKNRSSITLQVIRETSGFILGRRVNREGEDDSKMVDGVLIDRQHLIDKGLITWTQELKENQMYGHLEAVPGTRKTYPREI